MICHPDLIHLPISVRRLRRAIGSCCLLLIDQERLQNLLHLRTRVGATIDLLSLSRVRLPALSLQQLLLLRRLLLLVLLLLYDHLLGHLLSMLLLLALPQLLEYAMGMDR